MWRNREQSLKFQENRRGTLAFSREYDILMMVKDSQNSRRNDMRLSDSIETFIKTLLAEDEPEVELIGVEAAGLGIETGKHASAMALGEPGVLHGMRSYLLQDTDGNIQLAHSISAGLDYPGIGPIHANLAAQRRANVLAINDDEAIEAAYELTKLEGIIPALESAHALGALRKLKFKPEDIVVLTVYGRGDKDIETYLSFNEQQ